MFPIAKEMHGHALFSKTCLHVVHTGTWLCSQRVMWRKILSDTAFSFQAQLKWESLQQSSFYTFLLIFFKVTDILRCIILLRAKGEDGYHFHISRFFNMKLYPQSIISGLKNTCALCYRSSPLTLKNRANVMHIIKTSNYTFRRGLIYI